jgi:hypothetical protein
MEKNYNMPILDSTRKIAAVFKKVPLTEKCSDFSYWQTESYQSRLAALESLREDYHHWKYATEPRLQRVYTILKRQ